MSIKTLFKKTPKKKKTKKTPQHQGVGGRLKTERT